VIRSHRGTLVASSFLILSLAMGTQLALAGPLALGPAADFNIFVFGDDTQGNSDTEGRVAVGGNAYFSASGWTIGTQASGSTTNLIVGGNLSNTYNTVHGNVLVNGNVAWTGPTIQGSLAVNGNANFGNSGGQINGPVDVVGTYTAPNYFPANQHPATVTPLPFNFASVKTSLQGESNYLAGITPNGNTAVSFGALVLTASGPTNSFYVFDVTGAQMTAAAGHGLSITVPTGSTVVVNVDGTSDSMTSMGISLNGVDNQHVLYNFSQATSLTVNQIGIEGTILAPNAAVNFINGQINGSLIAQSIAGQGESHQHLFIGNLPTNPIPEPSTFVLAACGLAAFAGARAYRARLRVI
jgi:choice-of-anchor A domain-containing protein